MKWPILEALGLFVVIREEERYESYRVNCSFSCPVATSEWS